MSWQQFVMDLQAHDADQVEEILLRHGAQSVTLTDAGDKPVLEPAPGETPLWSDTAITGLFGDDTNFCALRDDLSAELGDLPAHRIEPLEDRAWEREWLKDFGPMQFGERLWICPGDSEAPEGAVAIRLDPGLAFGTGTHPTTALCLEWLDGIETRGKRLLDYGCGSGVLAIAGLKLGCREAVGMDIDPQAVTASLENARNNGIGGEFKVYGRDADIEGSFELLVANILAGPLADLSESLVTRLSSGGEIALSGILSEQVDEVRGAYDPWIAFDEPVFRSQGTQEWVLLRGTRRAD